MTLHCPDSLTAVAELYNHFHPSRLDRLGDIYGPGVIFEDPLRTANGLDQIAEIFAQRFRRFEGISIVVLDAHGDDRTGFLAWTMRYNHRAGERTVHGSSHCRFANDGRIREQRDCWDATGALFGDMPVVGRVLDFLKKRSAKP